VRCRTDIFAAAHRHIPSAMYGVAVMVSVTPSDKRNRVVYQA